MTAARISRVVVEVMFRPFQAPPPDSNADLQQPLDSLALAASATAAAQPRRGTVLQAVVLEVLSRKADAACHCVITPAAPPVKYLMRRRPTSP